MFSLLARHVSVSIRTENQLSTFGVNIVNDRIVVDDIVITSYCPETAADVVFEILKNFAENNKSLSLEKPWDIWNNRLKFLVSPINLFPNTKIP